MNNKEYLEIFRSTLNSTSDKVYYQDVFTQEVFSTIQIKLDKAAYIIYLEKELAEAIDYENYELAGKIKKQLETIE